MSAAPRARVVLVGAGYTSVWAYRAMRRWAGHRLEVVVVTPQDVHVFHGFTGEVLTGDLPPGSLTSPLTEVFPGAELLRGSVVRVDTDARSVSVQRPDGELVEVGYDHLVVGTGSHDRTSTATGLSEHALWMRGPGDAERVLQHLSEVSSQARRDQDEPRLRTVVVVGGGIAGVEAAAAVAQARLPTPLRVVLVSSRGQLATELGSSGKLSALARTTLTRLGVEVLTGRRVREVSAAGVRLDDGTEIAAATVLATTGSEGRPLPGLDHFDVDATGRLLVDSALQLTGGVWVGGDAAHLVHPKSGTAPAMAGPAILSGTAIGRNVARVVTGRPPKPFTLQEVGQAAALGRGLGLMNLGGLEFSGRSAWWGRAAFFLWYVPSRRQAGRIARGWVSGTRAAGPTAAPAPRAHHALPAVVDVRETQDPVLGSGPSADHTEHPHDHGARNTA